MKIIYFSPHPNLFLNISSGPGVHMREMINAMEELGHEVKPVIMGGIDAQFHSSGNDSKGSTSLKDKAKKFIPNRIWSILKDFKLTRFDQHAKDMLRKAVEDFQPDLIYERANFSMTSGVELASEMGIRHVLEMNAPYPEEKAIMEGKGLQHAFAVRQESVQLTKTDVVVVVSTALEKYVLDRNPYALVIVTPNAIRKNFKPNGKGVQIREELSIPKEAVLFGFVGSIFPYHGVDRLITAFTKVKGNAQLLIVGDGYVLPELKQQANSSGVADLVHFTGGVPHSEVPSYLDAMDVTIMATSNWYGSPVKIFEYGALKKAIIAPDVVPVQDVMVSNEDGLLVAPTETSIAEAMNTLLNDAELREKLASNFNGKVMENHTWDQMAKKVISALERIKK